MNKSILLLIVFFTLSTSYCKGEIILTKTYLVTSDIQTDTIPMGKCRVIGKVYEGDSQKPVEGGFISDLQQMRYTQTNENGEFSILLTEDDSVIYFFHPQYGEIVCWNYDFQSQHLVTMDFVTDYAGANGWDIMDEKPVIYLYGEQGTEVNLTLKPKGHFTFTYPEYKNGWDVKIKSNNLLEVDGNLYPYLFWEAVSNLNFLGQPEGLHGYYIKTDTTIQFLEKVLAQMGLNSTEKTDFITYWGPRLIKHSYAAIQFFVDDAYDTNVAKLEVNPKPDSQRRIYMVFRGSEINIKPNYFIPPIIIPFEREGLTLVEWGGSELNN